MTTELLVIIAFVKGYCDVNEFEKYLYDNYELIEDLVGNEMTLQLLTIDYKDKSSVESIIGKLRVLITDKYAQDFEMINDAYFEGIANKNNDSVINSMVDKYFSRIDEAVIDFSNINTYEEMIKIISVKIVGIECNNWNAIADLVLGVNLPKRIRIKKIKCFEERFPRDAVIFQQILDKAQHRDCLIIYTYDN